MLYREYKDTKSKWSYTEWRYWCECGDASHALLISIDKDTIIDTEISVIGRPYMTLWNRIKNAFLLLFGKEVIYLGVVINEKDRKELAKVLAGDNNEKS